MKNSFSLIQLNEHLQRVIAYNMTSTVWINCEIADVSNSKGTVYLSLVERQDNKVQARAEAIVWKRSLDKIYPKIGDILWSILQIGRQVLIEVEVEFHPLYGMKFIVKDIDPSLTIGQLELNRLKVLKQLEQEQFTNLNAQVPVSAVWQRIAVISSKEAAGLQDFLEQLQSNPHQYHFNCEVFHATVQGQTTTREIQRQIEKIEQNATDFDCVVIVRGGGARLDLMGFDDYDLCVSIATCELPVLTGIGHDIDETLADMVAHKALKTPTAVADYLIERMLQFEQELFFKAQSIKQTALKRLNEEKTQLALLSTQLKYKAEMRFKIARQQLLNLEDRLQLLDPNATFERGFTLVTDAEGRIIQSKNQLSEEQEYRLYFKDGYRTIKPA